MRKFWIANQHLAVDAKDVSSCDIIKWDERGTKQAVYATVYGKVPTIFFRNVVAVLDALEAVEDGK